MNFQLRMAENSEFSAAKQWRADADPADSIPKRIMNKGFYKLVYSRVRHMLVAVADFASAHRTAPGARRPATRSHHAGTVPALRALVLAAMVLIGNVILSAPSIAQIVAVPGSGAQVIQTQNGLPQVNISRPSSAGVSVNNYSQFDVQRQGAILNNAATIITQTGAGPMSVAVSGTLDNSNGGRLESNSTDLNGTPGSGNVTIAGSNVNASDVVLAAANQVNLIHSTDTDSTRSSNESKSGSVGVSFGSQGYGISASGSRAHGDANADSAAQNNTHISGANSVSIVSGGDTNIKGATVDGGQVSALIGGNLNIESVQDTSHSAAHQASQSAGVSISQAGGSASYSQQKGDAHGDYAGVEEQSGIHAGAGGFDINVKGNTDLKGAYISSDAEAAKNTLTTGTLSFSDIANASNYDAKSSGFSAGGSMGAPNSAKANGVTAVSDGGGVSPMISQNDSGNEHATTKSGISAGTIFVGAAMVFVGYLVIEKLLS